MKKIITVLFLSISCAIYADVVTWKTGAGSWSNSPNWSSGSVPTGASDVGLYSNVTVSISNVTATANSITMNPAGLAGNLQLEGTVGSALHVIGNFTQNNGSFSVRQIAALTPGAVIGGNYYATKGQVSLLQRGNSQILLDVAGDLTATSDFDFRFALNGGKEFGAISVGGTTTLGNADLVFYNTTSTSTNNTLLLIRNTSANALVGTFGNATFGVTTYTLNGTSYTLRAVDYDGGGVANDVVLTTVVPEPATVGLFAVSGVVVLFIRRLRR